LGAGTNLVLTEEEENEVREVIGYPSFGGNGKRELRRQSSGKCYHLLDAEWCGTRNPFFLKGAREKEGRATHEQDQAFPPGIMAQLTQRREPREPGEWHPRSINSYSSLIKRGWWV